MLAIRAIHAIEWGLALATLGGSIVSMASAFSENTSATADILSSILSAPLSEVVWAFLLVLGAAMVIYGLVRPSHRLRSHGWMLIVAMRLFQVFGTLFLLGPVSNWLFPLEIAGVAAVLYLYNRASRDRTTA